MREIFPFAGIAVFQIDEEMEWNARTTPDHVGKALQSLGLRHWRGSEGKFDGGKGLVHGLLLRLDERHGQTTVTKIFVQAKLKFFGIVKRDCDGARLQLRNPSPTLQANAATPQALAGRSPN